MKGYYLFAPVEPQCVGPDSGVERKVRAQHKALSSFVDCELVILPPVEYTGSVSEKIIRRLPFTAAWRKWEYKGEFDGADFVYIRMVYHDASFVRYLRDIKIANPNIKIIYEIPTYPYMTEKSASASTFSFVKKEKLNCEKAAKYMDAIVTFYGQDEIWGVPCIKTINGYDFSKVTLPQRKKSDKIEFMSVAMNAFWHGYDRVIEGLHQYYENGGEENFVYHLVGPEVPEYKELTEKYDLSEHVVLYGRKSGSELEEIYENCLLGIDILGGHRKDFPVSSTLKSREYGAWGLPLITSSPVDYIPQDYEYQFLAPYDDSPLDMTAVAEFYHRIYDARDCDTVAADIRSFSEGKCNMEATMKPVADWLER